MCCRAGPRMKAGAGSASLHRKTNYHREIPTVPRAPGPQHPKNLLRHLPILEYHYLACIGHAEEPT